MLLCVHSSGNLSVKESNTHSTDQTKLLVDGFSNTENHGGMHTKGHREIHLENYVMIIYSFS